MRTTLAALTLVAALLAACGGSGQPGSPAATVYGTLAPAQATAAPMPTY